jgi:hypothetical protein
VTTVQAGRDATAFLATASRLRRALTEREEFIRPSRERYDRFQDDPRLTPAQRVKIGGELLRAAHKADHIYEGRLNEALEEYRELMSSELESRY